MNCQYECIYKAKMHSLVEYSPFVLSHLDQSDDDNVGLKNKDESEFEL